MRPCPHPTHLSKSHSLSRSNIPFHASVSVLLKTHTVRALCSKQKKDVIKNVLKLPSKRINNKVIGYIIENYFMQHLTTQLPVFLWLHTSHDLVLLLRMRTVLARFLGWLPNVCEQIE